jgi:Flp pilus assembly protein TadG
MTSQAAARRAPSRRRRLVRRLGRGGAATVDFVLWLPVFFTLLGVIVDASLAMHALTRMQDAARVAARSVALGVQDEATAATQVRGRLPPYDGLDVVVGRDAAFVTADVAAPLASVTVFAGRFAGDRVLSARTVMLREDAAAVGGG